VPTLYRVFPYLPDAGLTEPGGALYRPPAGGGRIDNPDFYSVLYLGDSAAGAVAEAFGRFPEWTPAILVGSPSLSQSVRALACYHLPDEVRVCDLDDPKRLITLGLKPSDVVSRDYARTRAWARGIYERGEWAGIRWWSYYDSRWASFGLWAIEQLILEEVKMLTLGDAALRDAAHTIIRRVTTKGLR
jgi:hypothetical protein